MKNSSMSAGRICGQCRTPHGVRGLKYLYRHRPSCALWSHSAWSAWIENNSIPYTIPVCCRRTPHGVRGLKSPPKAIYFTFLFMSHSARSAWIEIPNTVIFGKSATGSHSAWSAWIEICFGYCCKDFPYQVALRMECVD